MMAGRVHIWDETTTHPISLIGKAAGVCWGANTTDYLKNYKRGLDCLSSGHGRTWEFPQVYITIEGYSARMMRELYTHIGGAPTRLQASTRYINYENFEYIEPRSVDLPETEQIYNECMDDIRRATKKLSEMGVPKEDIANLLPLGMTSKMVLRTNLRNLIDMSHQRMCTRAYWEFREFMKDLIKALNEYGQRYAWGTMDQNTGKMVSVNEWEILTSVYFKPKCDVTGFCTENKSCGRKKSYFND